SFSAFPSNRPLAQLSFGINHALSGLDPWAFKTTNLAIHLLSGLLVYVFIRLVLRALAGGTTLSQRDTFVATAVAAVWLLHPMHVSTVLYAVQRMTGLSTLFTLAALSSYFWGRIRIAEERSGALWILGAIPLAALGFLAKENAVLLPLLLLVSELTVLRGVSTGHQRRFVRAAWILMVALPLLAGAAYFFTHPGLLNYDGRPFSLEERVLTQTRILWLYVQWLFIPDISAFGLFHDDIALSTGLTSPITTLISAIGLLGATLAALLMRRRLPVFSFAVLFFLAGHALESSVFPLEMVFEHRNYLPSVGLLFLLAYLVIVSASGLKIANAARVLGVLLLLSYTTVTYIRVNNWSNLSNFLLSSAENHPRSPRANFMAAQLLISSLDRTDSDSRPLAAAARTFLDNGLSNDPRCINCLFGLVVLELHMDRQPDAATVQRLREALGSGQVGATEVSISQFSYLVKWQQSEGVKLPPQELEAIFDAALSNPGWNHTGRAGIEAAYREYHEKVSGNLDAALIHARAAIDAWPDQWSYHMQLVQVLRKLGNDDAALAALENAVGLADNQKQQQQMADVRAATQRERSK
ncbi:MAG: hypothetical protein KDI55_21780, partial [Anaerolineae bacterium]|nr:hypothetical protein [Anaerolineae bacterium]